MMARFAFFFVSFLFVFISAGVMGQYENCTGQLDEIGDGQCDIGNNNADCGYDGGDCCECSCTNDRIYPCGIRGFNCSDPYIIGNERDCCNETASVRHCASDATLTWLVNDTASAMSLAEAVNCSGGTFNVTWLGSVLVNRTLYIPNNTTLYVTGGDSGAEVNGGGKTRLFMAAGADLHIQGLVVSNGNATYGGAIAATRSRISLNQTVFSGNTASSYGGAINVGIASTIVGEGETMLKGNYAGYGGGAVAIMMSYFVSWDGETSFINNTANYDGGAWYVSSDSSVSWNGKTTFVSNMAKDDGGALFVDWNSSVSWDGDTSFVNNTANDKGGTLYVSSDSSASWDGETSFVSNTANDKGGALYVSSGSSVSWDGDTSFVNNTANDEGGALHVSSGSSVSWNGETSFISNTANDSGGALYVSSDSGVSWDGDTSFVSDMAKDDGGALFVCWNSSVSWDGDTSFVNNTANDKGGTLYVSSDSSASWDGETSFVNNTANDKGGALYVSSGSSVSWDGDTSFVNNTANDEGGALSVSSGSSVSWDGDTSFVNNMANDEGGALSVSSDSGVSWDGETSFVNNTANDDGGALSVSSGSSVSWDGDTSFVNNMANDEGGALSVSSDSGVSWDGETSFVNNTANDDGGALYVSSESSVSWCGKTTFVSNTVNDDGGALSVSSDSSVSWDGETSFLSNTAKYDGGALYVYWNSSVSWDGETSFVNNAANDEGGALHVYSNSSVSWDGETSFVSNTANDDGGALYVHLYSSCSWAGNTSFVDNTANDDGGALYVSSESGVSWDGETPFVNNTANDDGGALYVSSESSVSWDGETSFVGNIASSSGGAIYVQTSSNISVGGDTRFVDNEADADGGAAYIYVGYGDVTSSYFILCSNAAVCFHGNTCGGNGGAIAFIGEVVTRFSINTTFLENAAGVSGGAVYMSGVPFGIRFEGVIFRSNSAVIGGGLYSTGSGTAVTEDENRSPEYNPTTLIGCEFMGNTAMKTGGAMDSGAGRDWIENTLFVGNTASLGGALRLVGTTSLTVCDFVNNLSDENGGPAISNDGIISDISNCSFVDNVFNCQTGFYLAYENTDALFETVCKGCDTLSSECPIKDKEPICHEELEHSNSTGGSTTLESLLIERGYWRATNTSTDVLACYNPDACLGGLTGDQGYCSKGYEGPYCSLCSKGYAASLGFACNKCSDNAAGSIALAIAMAAVFLLASVAFLYYTLSGEIEGVDQGIVARVTRFIPLQSVKIVIVVWQIVTQFSTVANVVFPSVYQTFLDGVDFLNFDLSWVLSTGCVIDTDFHDQLLLATLGPLVCIVILGGTYVYAMRRIHDSETARGIARQKHMSMVLLLTFLIYSSVSSILFKTFSCDKLDDGKNYLRADYRIECDSSKHKALEIYAGLMVVLYVVGIPAFYGVLLYNNREALMNNAGRADEGVRFVTDLWKPYRPDRFYYEVIECIRRVSLTGALVFIYPNTAAQIVVALMMATFFMIVSEALAPYASSWDTWISRSGHAIVYTSMFLALLLKVDVSGDPAGSQRVFEWVLIGAHSCLILVVVVEGIAMIVVWRQEVKEESGPRMHSSHSVLSSDAGRGVVILDNESPPPYEDFEGHLP